MGPCAVVTEVRLAQALLWPFPQMAWSYFSLSRPHQHCCETSFTDQKDFPSKNEDILGVRDGVSRLE